MSEERAEPGSTAGYAEEAERDGVWWSTLVLERRVG
jgi:hypothetical protein